MFKMPDEGEELIIKGRTVFINIPGDGDAVTKAEIKADFLLLPQDEVDSLIEAARDGDSDADILRRVLRGWSGVENSDGSKMEFSTENLNKILKITYVRSALLETYFSAAGGRKAKRGNLR